MDGLLILLRCYGSGFLRFVCLSIPTQHDGACSIGRFVIVTVTKHDLYDGDITGRWIRLMDNSRWSGQILSPGLRYELQGSR